MKDRYRDEKLLKRTGRAFFGLLGFFAFFVGAVVAGNYASKLVDTSASATVQNVGGVQLGQLDKLELHVDRSGMINVVLHDEEGNSEEFQFVPEHAAPPAPPVCCPEAPMPSAQLDDLHKKLEDDLRKKLEALPWPVHAAESAAHCPCVLRQGFCGCANCGCCPRRQKVSCPPRPLNLPRRRPPC